MKKACFAGAAVLILIAGGCSGRKPESGGTPATQGSSVMDIVLMPEQPRLGDPIEARVDVRSNPGEAVAVRYQWLINGTPVAGAKARIFDTRGAHKGDQISVRVGIQGQAGEVESRKVTIANTPPKILSVTVSPAKPMVGQDLTGAVQAEDRDGDNLRYQYQWVKNRGDVSGATQATFPASQIKRGDEVSVKVVVSDGESTSENVQSLPVTVSGRPPIILSQPPMEAPQGGIFQYQVVARDPDGGPVTYALVSGPPGMTINFQTGLLTWTLPEARGGIYSVTVRASDPDGFTDQNLNIRY